MSQLFFKYGAMNSGKTIDILKVAHNYEEQGKKVCIFTSAMDDRDGVGQVASRIGIERSAVAITEYMDIYQHVANLARQDKIYCILIDEAQFLSEEHIYQLSDIVDQLNIPVMAYGLKNDFQNELFEGSKHLLLLADKIEEIKTICWFCEKKATMNLRVDNHGYPVFTGEQIEIGGNERYYPVCRRHYKNPLIQEEE